MPVVAKTEPEMAPNRSGVTVPPGNTGLANAGVVGAHKNEAAVAALAVTRGSRLGDVASASNVPDLDKARAQAGTR